ncbi:single-stranded-DNA-specific exonuclease RecJ [Candidatus Kaiserbacteria bacterium]|nr:single-stranded-DNA-specific exonuclease RecJ [Candidatus Kaiserbacteria bacterium]
MALRPIYRLHEPVSEAVAVELASYDPLVQQLLYNRSIIDRETAERFLNPDYEQHLHDPFLLTDMDRAVERILVALAEGEHILIYSDYDCDGIPGGVVLHDFLTALGHARFTNYIPHRHEEGYGFNAASVDQFVAKGVSLIVTVDCGITDHEAVAAAQAAGIDVIVTDHHEPGATLPGAYAVVNPKRDGSYPFPGLCGTGVAYKLAQAVLARGRERGVVSLTEGKEKWWLDMVGVATIADMVPLQDENRVLAHYGLTVLRKSRRPGLQQLLRAAGARQSVLTEDDVGFTIGPRINAASRMDTPEDAFHLLRTTDEVEAGTYVSHLEKLNNERKGVVAAMTREAKKKLLQHETLPSVIVLGNPSWRPSLVGLVAGSLAEEFSRPAFVWGRDGQGVLKGSCRSGSGVSVVTLMEATPDSFRTFGGHHASGGFSVADDAIHTLSDDLARAQETLVTTTDTGSEECVDADLSLADITPALLRSLRSLAPYGVGNPKPLFRFHDVIPENVAVFGKAKNHTKLTFALPGRAIEAIAFFKTPDQFVSTLETGTPLTLIAHVEESFFMGRMQTRLRIVDVV